MLDILIAAILAGLGFLAGRRTALPQRIEPTVQEQELQRLQEDRAAFTQLMGYNTDRAYGRDLD